MDCDALVIADEPVPAYELAGQAGVALMWDAERACFAPRADDEGGTNTAGVYVSGSLRRRFDDDLARRDDGLRVARRVLRDLAGATA
jgi:hypothetical protein